MRNLNQGPSGGNNGEAKAFADEPLPNSRVEEVRVWYGKRVDSVQMILDTGELEKHGGGGGDHYGQFKLQEGDYITQIEVRHGTEVDSLTIHSELQGPRRFGGDGGDVTAVYEATEKTRIAGFTGRSGKVIDAIGVVLQES